MDRQPNTDTIVTVNLLLLKCCVMFLVPTLFPVMNSREKLQPYGGPFFSFHLLKKLPAGTLFHICGAEVFYAVSAVLWSLE